MFFNAWPTARRFPKNGSCLLSEGCHGEDAIEHYYVCRHVWGFSASYLRRPPPQGDLYLRRRAFLLLDEEVAKDPAACAQSFISAMQEKKDGQC